MKGASPTRRINALARGATNLAGAEAAVPRATLGAAHAVALIVGVVVGAGIFKAPAMVAGLTRGGDWMFAAWAAGGAISLIGALCYAELTTAYPDAGGDYHYLRRAYGNGLAFLFAWARFSVIATGSIALLAFAFGDYLQQVLPLGPAAAGSAAYAAAIIVALTWVNLRGLHTGMAAQAWLTVLEVAGLLLVVAAALALPAGPARAAASAPEAAPGVGAFGLALVFVLLTYGGWNEVGCISAEVRDGRRNMLRALALSIGIITALYLLVNWACWRVLGIEGLAHSSAPAADVMRRAFGRAGEVAIAALVAVSAVTSINATIIVGARTSYAAGCDWRPLRRLGRWDGARNTPAAALRAQCAAALLLVLAGALGGGGFRAMVEFTAPVFWLFFLLTGAALMVLRRREPATPRPFKVPLYPVLPLLFCAMCAYMLWSSLSYVHDRSLGGWNAAWIGVAVLAAGLVLLLAMRRWAGRPGRAADV